MSSRMVIRVSLSIYWAILFLYPRGFRNAFGQLMLQTFEESLEAEHHSLRGFCKAWSAVIRELPKTVVVQQLNELRQYSGQSVRGFVLGIAVPAVLLLLLRSDELRFQESFGIAIATLAAVYPTIATRARSWKCLTRGTISGSVTITLCVLLDAMTSPPVNHAVYGLVVYVLCFSVLLLSLSLVMQLIIEGIAKPIKRKADCSLLADTAFA